MSSANQEYRQAERRTRCARLLPIASSHNLSLMFVIFLLVSGAILSGGSGLLAAGGFSLPWTLVSGGGGTSSGGTFRVSSSLGQVVADTPTTGGTFRLQSGFWAIANDTPPTETTTELYLPLIANPQSD